MVAYFPKWVGGNISKKLFNKTKNENILVSVYFNPTLCKFLIKNIIIFFIS